MMIKRLLEMGMSIISASAKPEDLEKPGSFKPFTIAATGTDAVIVDRGRESS